MISCGPVFEVFYFSGILSPWLVSSCFLEISTTQWRGAGGRECQWSKAGPHLGGSRQGPKRKPQAPKNRLGHPFSATKWANLKIRTLLANNKLGENMTSLSQCLLTSHTKESPEELFDNPKALILQPEILIGFIGVEWGLGNGYINSSNSKVQPRLKGIWCNPSVLSVWRSKGPRQLPSVTPHGCSSSPCPAEPSPALLTPESTVWTGFHLGN